MPGLTEKQRQVVDNKIRECNRDIYNMIFTPEQRSNPSQMAMICLDMRKILENIAHDFKVASRAWRRRSKI